MDGRLETVAPDLAAILRSEDVPVLRRVSAVAVRWVLAETGVEDPRISKGLTALGSGSYGDTTSYVDVTALTEELDQKAWDLSDGVEAGHHEEDEYNRVFDRARAVNALSSALQSDPLEATFDSVYESLIATNQPEQLRAAIDRAIQGSAA